MAITTFTLDKFNRLLEQTRTAVKTRETIQSTPEGKKQLLTLTELRKRVAAMPQGSTVEIPLTLPLAVPVGLQPTRKDNPFMQEVDDTFIDFLSNTFLPTELIPVPSSQGSKEQENIHIGVTRNVTLNQKQQEASDKVVSGQDVIIVGAAGTGKTTLMRQTTRRLIDSGKFPTIREATKWLGVGSPGIAILSFTRKAVNNIRYAVVDELKANTLTIHKLLEFAPKKYIIADPEHPGKMKQTVRFEPQRNAANPLPRELKLLVFEESSMISLDLYEMLQDAMPHPHQEVFIGDIQQLPPTFGMAILGFKMLELPIVELTEVYRQALESPILAMAWKLLEGDPHVFSGRLEEYYDEAVGKKKKRAPALEAWNQTKYDEEGNFLGSTRFHIWQKTISPELALRTIGAQFCHWEQQGFYYPDSDVILCPYNKAFGTIEINAMISNYLGIKRGAIVHEVIAGYNKHYLAIGDRVLYDKEDAEIVNIAISSSYTGERPSPASKKLDRWGVYQEVISAKEIFEHDVKFEEIDTDAFMEAAATEIEDRVTVASHGVTIRYSATGEEQVLEAASEINNLLGGYALTVHKFQGSEADRVFLVLHQSHAKMVSRELLYTAVTRAKKFLYIICEPKSFFNGISSQRIKGSTLAEKAEQFTGAKNRMEAEKKQKELLEREKERKEHEEARLRREKWDKDEASEQQSLLAMQQKEDEKKAALDKVMESKPQPKWKFNITTGKMEIGS